MVINNSRFCAVLHVRMDNNKKKKRRTGLNRRQLDHSSEKLPQFETLTLNINLAETPTIQFRTATFSDEWGNNIHSLTPAFFFFLHLVKDEEQGRSWRRERVWGQLKRPGYRVNHWHHQTGGPITHTHTYTVTTETFPVARISERCPCPQ